jgi:hypothetical protein
VLTAAFVALFTPTDRGFRLLGTLAVALLVTATDLAAQEWATYRHPVGFSVRYPASWQIHESLDGVAFVPGDAATDGMGQPLELFMLASDDAPGIQDPTSAEVVAYFQQQLPGFRMVGRAERVENPIGPASIMTFEGSMGGPALRQRTYLALARDKGIFLAHLATTEHAARRDGVARQIFDSFHWGEASLDPALVGSWSQSGGGTSESLGGQFSSVGVERSYRFEPNGTAFYSSESSVSVDVEGLSGGRTSSSSNRGTWSAGSGVLYIRYQDGTEHEFQYRLTGGGLQLTDAEGTSYTYSRGG